jgi:hypothetical protein
MHHHNQNPSDSKVMNCWEDGNRFSFRNAVFSSYSELWTMVKVHKPGDSELLLCS